MTPRKPKHLHQKSGPKSIFDPEKCSKIIEYVSDGQFVAQACENVGYRISTFYEHLDSHPQIAEAFSRARRSQSQSICRKMFAYLEDGSDASMSVVTKRRNIADKYQWFLSVNCKDFRRDRTGKDELDETVIKEWNKVNGEEAKMALVAQYVAEGKLSIEGARKYQELIKMEVEISEVTKLRKQLNEFLESVKKQDNKGEGICQQ